MAKVKKKEKVDAIDGAGQPIVETCHDFGLCKDCEKTVEWVVEAYQFSSTNRFICPKCMESRIRKAEAEKAEGKIAQLRKKIAEAEERSKQQPLELQGDASE